MICPFNVNVEKKVSSCAKNWRKALHCKLAQITFYHKALLVHFHYLSSSWRIDLRIKSAFPPLNNRGQRGVRTHLVTGGLGCCRVRCQVWSGWWIVATRTSIEEWHFNGTFHLSRGWGIYKRIIVDVTTIDWGVKWPTQEGQKLILNIRKELWDLLSSFTIF